MSTIKYLTNLDLRGNKLLNVTLGPINGSTKPHAFGVDEDGYLVVNDADGLPRRYTTLAEVEAAIAAALEGKLNKSGGMLTGAAYYAEGVQITSEDQLVHKAYVDGAFQAAVEGAAPQEGRFISISEEREISVDRQALNIANNVTLQFQANEEGVVEFQAALSAVNVAPVTRMKWVVTDAAGEEVDFRIGFNVNDNIVFVEGQGAEPSETFNLYGQA